LKIAKGRSANVQDLEEALNTIKETPEDLDEFCEMGYIVSAALYSMWINLKAAKWCLTNLNVIQEKNSGLNNMNVFRNTATYADYLECAVKDLNGRALIAEIPECKQNCRCILAKLKGKSTRDEPTSGSRQTT